MSEIVYDIQRAQGTPEHTLDPEPFNPVPLLEAGFQGVSQAMRAYGKASAGGKQKDYAPLVNALNEYRDIVQARSMSPAYQQNLWDSLTEWAASQGYTSSEIDGFAGTTNTSIPNKSLTAYVQDKQSTLDAQQKALRDRAKVNYPDLDPDKAMELQLLDMSEAMNIKSIGNTSQSMPADIAKALVGNNMGMIERYASRRVDTILRSNGGPVNSAGLATAINDVVGEFIQYGFNPEHVAFLERYLYNLYEPMTEEGNKRLNDISKSFEDREKIAAHDKNMQEIRNGMLLADAKNVWLSTPQPYEYPISSTEKATVTLTGAQVAVVADVSPESMTALIANNFGVLPKIFSSTQEQGGISKNNMTPTEASIFVARPYADMLASSPNNNTRRNGAATQMNGYSALLKDMLSGPIDPRSRLSDMVRIINNSIILDAKDYQSSQEQVLSNRDTVRDMLERMGRTLGNELNNSLPLFNDNGELRMYLINKVDDQMVSEDITEGYSKFSDRATFDQYYKTGIPAALLKLSNATGWSVNELKMMFNEAMVKYSRTGRDLALNQQTRGRHFSTESGFEANEPLTDSQIKEAVKLAKSENAPGQIIPGIYDRDPFRAKIRYVIKGVSEEKAEPIEETPVSANVKVIEDSSISYENNRAIVKGSQGAEVKAPVSGKVLFASTIGRNEHAVLIEDTSGSIWTVNGTGMSINIGEGQTVEEGSTIAQAGKSGEVTVSHYSKGIFGNTPLDIQGTPQPQPLPPNRSDISVKPVSGSYEAPAQVAPFIASKLEEASGETLTEEDRAKAVKKIEKILESHRDITHNAINASKAGKVNSLLGAGLSVPILLLDIPVIGPFLAELVGAGSLGMFLGDTIVKPPKDHPETEEIAKEAIRNLLKK